MKSRRTRIWLVVLAIAALTFVGREVKADGLLMKTNSDTLLHHVSTVVHVSINEMLASTVVDLAFLNTLSQDSIWVKFAFPVPEKAVVTDFGVYKNGAIWFYKVSATDTAHGNQGIPQNDETLREYLGPNPFVIAVKIGRGLAKFRLKYVQVVDFRDGFYVYTYPLETSEVTTAPLDTFALTLSLTSSHQILDAECTSHPSYNFELVENQGDLVVFGATFPVNKDVRVRYRLEQPGIEATVYSYRTPSDPQDRDGYFAVIFRPPSIELAEVLEKYFAFIIDRSGSMSGDRLRYAKDAAKRCIMGLTGKDVFNVIWFSSTEGAFSDTPVPASDENKQAAVTFIESLRASGSTNLYSPVLKAVQQADPSRVNQIVLLTDGYHNAGPVLNRGQVITRITQANVSGARIFCFGISQGADLSFLAKLAEANGGAAYKIDTADEIGPAVLQFFQAIKYPILQVEGVTFEGVEPFEIYPKVLQDISTGQQLIVTGRYHEGGTGVMTLHARLRGSDTTFVYENISLADSSVEYPFVRKLWAKQKIDYLYQQWLAQGQPEALRQQIIELSIVYGVLSPFTEFSQPEPPSTPVEDAGILASLQASVNWAAGSPTVHISWSVSPASDEGLVDVWRQGPGGVEEHVARVPLSSGGVVDRAVEEGKSYRYRVVVTDASGEVVATRELTVRVPVKFGLSRAYPNPFNSSTVFSLSLPNRTKVTVEVRDLLGRRIKLLLAGEVQGTRRLQWDGKDEQGQDVPSGLYLVRAVCPGRVWIRKVALVR
ncbi:MAG: VWA domain-containing protein [Calditrichaeota bacterium]|nr:VWA domain-containing protein [Calditrichota bacterium]